MSVNSIFVPVFHLCSHAFFYTDIEGAEEYALADFHWDRYSFNVITIEGHNQNIDLKLIHNGYRFVTRLGEDALWVNGNLMDQDEARDLIDDLIH